MSAWQRVRSWWKVLFDPREKDGGEDEVLEAIHLAQVRVEARQMANHWIEVRRKANEEREEMKARYIYRSAKTGKFVTAKYAKRYPHLTVRERV